MAPFTQNNVFQIRSKTVPHADNILKMISVYPDPVFTEQWWFKWRLFCSGAMTRYFGEQPWTTKLKKLQRMWIQLSCARFRIAPFSGDSRFCILTRKHCNRVNGAYVIRKRTDHTCLPMGLVLLSVQQVQPAERTVSVALPSSGSHQWQVASLRRRRAWLAVGWQQPLWFWLALLVWCPA